MSNNKTSAPMHDERFNSECVSLGAPASISHELTGIVPELRRIARRPALAASPLWKEHGEKIGRVTRALAHAKPASPAPTGQARFIRVASWNIERGKEADGQIAFIKDHPALSEADVLLLNEVDIGMARSGNRDIVREISEALGFEYVFGNSYLCLDPGNIRDGASGEENSLGLHGNAILSRHPILRAENVSLAITKDKFHSSEKRLGHKKALWAEVQTPLGKLPVATAHLDSGAAPWQRAAQLRDLLARLEERGVAERCVLGGDLNTTTYDLKSLPRFAWNIFKKLLRGGFPHAIHHYVHPYEIYDKPVFDALDAAGFDWKGFNAPAVGTTRYEVGTFDSESKVRDYLPEIFVKILAWRLKPWNGVAPLKIDWFSGRGVRALAEAEIREESGRVSLAPQSFYKPRHGGVLLSDHDPIVVDVVF